MRRSRRRRQEKDEEDEALSKSEEHTRYVHIDKREEPERERRSKWVVFGDVVEMFLLCSSLDLNSE